MQYFKCLNCDSDAAQCRGEIEGYQKSLFFKIYCCDVCNVSYVEPTRSNELIYDYIYDNVERIPGYARYFELAEEVLHAKDPLACIKDKEDCYYGVIDYLEKNIIDKRDLILEVGCGQGYLTYALNHAGYRAVGIDVSARVVGMAQKKYGDYYHCATLNDFVKLNKIKPKYVICTELIEHLENPREFLNGVLDLIDANGSVILTTPHKKSDNPLIWDSELPPVHLWWFSKEALAALANSLKVSFEFVSADGFYKNLKSNKPSIKYSESVNPPVFDEEFRVISPFKKKSRVRLFLRSLEKKLKSCMLKVKTSNESDALNPGASVLNKQSKDDLAYSLCCVLHARN